MITEQNQNDTIQPMIPPEAVQWRWLAAVIPHYYGKNRNGCMVHYQDGKSQLVQARCERVLEYWMEYYGTTLEAVQKRAKNWQNPKAVANCPWCQTVSGVFCR